MMKNFLSLFLLVVLSATSCNAVKGLRKKPTEENSVLPAFMKELHAITHQEVSNYDKRRQLSKLMKKYPRRELLFFDGLPELGDGGLFEDFDLEGVLEILTELAGLLGGGDEEETGGGGGGKFSDNAGANTVANVPEGSTVEAVTVTTYTITTPQGVQTTFTETQTAEEVAPSTMFVSQPGNNGAKGPGAKKGGKKRRAF